MSDELVFINPTRSTDAEHKRWSASFSDGRFPGDLFVPTVPPDPDVDA